MSPAAARPGQYPLVALRRPLRAFWHATIIACAAVIMTVVVPGSVAYHGQVFTRGQLEHKIQKQFVDNNKSSQFSPEMRTLWARYECQKAEFYNHKESKESDCGPDAPQPPVTLIPFLSVPSLWVDPIEFTCLAWLIILVRPIDSPVLRRGLNWWAWAIGLAVWIYLLKATPQFSRNFWFNTTDYGRTVFAYPNADIDSCSFWIQESISFIGILFLAVLWRQWVTFFEEQLRIVQGRDGDAVQLAFNTSRVNGLSNAYVHWQIASLLLALPFFLTTLFYWPVVFHHRDLRYVPSALISHVLWAVSWVFISLPLAVDWHSWSQQRSAAIAALRSGSNSGDLAALKELQPVSLVNLVGTGIGAVVGFVFPLLNAFRA
jgi:hypothetical protein